MTADRIDIVILTGFLGSGKTTLLQRLLRHPDFADTAVIVNELGEVGLDHELLNFSAERTVVMPGGCVCCSIREDIEETLRHLLAARDSERIPPFRRLVIETSGISDPVPILQTLLANPLARTRLQQPMVATVVDGLLARRTMADFDEAKRQIAQADVLIVSKDDRLDEDMRAELTRALRDLNPWSGISFADLRLADLSDLIPAMARSRPGSHRGRHDDTISGEATQFHGNVAHRSLIFEQPLDWVSFGVWITMLLHRHGSRILRIKGILAIAGREAPIVFNSAQHLVHPPVHLAEWPGDDKRSRLVIISDGIDPERIHRSLTAFNAAALREDRTVAAGLPVGGGGVIAGRPVRRPTAPAWIKG